MKKITTIFFLLFLLIQQAYLQTPCGVVLEEDFSTSQLPTGFSEVSTSGNVLVEDGVLKMDYNPSPKTQLKIDFNELSGNVFVNFGFETERNYFTVYGDVFNSNGEVIAQIVLGNNGTKGICISNEYVTSGVSNDFVNLLSENISTGTRYDIYLEIDTDSKTISGNVNGNILDPAQDVSLFSSSMNDVSHIVFVQDYMYGNDSDRDDVAFDDFQVINDPVNRLPLSDKIDEANEYINNAVVGTETGFYSQSDVDDFQNEIDQGELVLGDCNSTQTIVDQAENDLDQAIALFRRSENASPVSVLINSSEVHELTEGLAGYNVRIADSPWNFNNEVFREGVKNADVGFLRYFSGTTADYFDMNTGMYEPQWYEQVHSTSDGSKGWSGFPNLMKWQEGKGPSRLSDLYDLLGENEAKLVITWNGFVDSPDRLRNLAQFCKDNNIIVECWQFCNEPNFYIPDNRHFFNNGADYARKMKEFADAILSVDPDANLALSYGWDNWGGFSASIKDYQNSNGPFWTHPSIHSYPIHGSGVDFNSAMSSANAMLISRTDDAYFNSVEQRSWNGAQLLMTEYGVWNEYLKDKVYSGIYSGEFLTRMSVHPQAWLIGKHVINGAVQPVNDYKTEIWDAWENNYEFDADAFANDYEVNVETLPLLYITPAINNSKSVYLTGVLGGETVNSSSGEMAAVYAAGYVGNFDKDYLVLINKSDKLHEVELKIDGQILSQNISVYSAFSETPDGIAFESDTLQITSSALTLMPFSVTRVEWDKDQMLAPRSPRIYNVEHGDAEVTLNWWKREGADSYTLKYGTVSGQYDHSVEVTTNSATLSTLSPGTKYYFAVTASNSAGTSELSNEVPAFTGTPGIPEINYIHESDGRITIHWESVPFANGYKVKYGTISGDYTQEVDAKNVSGYVLRWLPNDTEYFITVCAYNNAGEGGDAQEVTATAISGRPWAPFLLQGNEKSDGTINLSWWASVNNNGATYDIYHCETPWDESSYTLVESGVQTNTYNDVTMRDAGRHFYRVKASNEKGESFFFSNIATVWKNQSGNTVGIEDVFAKKISVSPNPASSYVRIELAAEMGPVNYRMVNMNGEVLLEGELLNNKRLDVSRCNTGGYFLEFTMENERTIEKIVIKPEY
ncbi:fibronectin type III domain-containing protein [Marinilabilia rubra]|uniref:Fibronectin type-III domain-containing protein n=1 Tax=Marinilabilia rubra TaxID=2162893 RepID=A0A2U2BEA7_9BACT|nr:fibronectin type III domain-containing protein [Marinilabilia rubra]PWE01363.1 hypothetical protein DDZ16_02440 [Marinilabilia rubra]